MAEPIRPTNIEALIEGGVSGQVAVGNYNVQIHADHGAVVHFVPPERQPKPSPRPSPVLLRPRPFRGLLDRQADVGAATSALRDGLPVELHGPSGIGKSSLLRHLAYAPEAGSLPDGVVFLAARGQPAADLLQSLFDAFYECDRAFKPTDTEVRHHLQGRRALVLLDDVTLEREDVEALLDAAPGCAFVLASNERLLWGEARALPLGGLPTEDALALFERELGRALAAEERTDAADLCAAVGCHPLRILQAAALAREGTRSLAELTREARSAPGLEVVNRWTLDHLSGPERRVVAILAAADGAPVGIEPLQEMAGPEVDRLLEKLLERKVIQAHSPCYSLRIDLDEALQKAWQIEVWREQLWSRLTAWAERNPSRIREESASLQQALESAAEAESWETVRRLGRAIEAELAVGGRWGAWARVIGLVLTASESLRDDAGRAWALHQRGTRALCLGDRLAAHADLTRALSLRESLGDLAGAAVTRHNLGFLVGPPPTQESPPPRPGPRRFPRLLAWLGLPVLLVLLTLGGLKLFSGQPASDPDPPPVPETPEITPDPEPDIPPLPTTTPIDDELEDPSESPEDEASTDFGDPVEPARMELSPGTLDFSEQRVGRLGRATARVQNLGGSPLSLASFRITGADRESFTVTPGSCAGAVLAAGSECGIQILFNTGQARPHSARLEVTDQSGQTETVSLQGVGTAPDLRVEPTSLRFGSVEARSVVAPLRVSVSNAGTAPLRLERLALTENPGNAFTLKTDCAATLPPGAGCTAEVSFFARAPGTLRAILEVRSADEGIQPVTVGISGAVTAPPEVAKGWCCLEGKVSETTETACKESQGAFFKTRARARTACFVGGALSATVCCVDGVIRNLSTAECASQEGTPMTAAESLSRCPADDEEGWCCFNRLTDRQIVVQSSAGNCRRNGGGFGKTEDAALRNCVSKGDSR